VRHRALAVHEVVQPVEEEPGAIARVVAHQLARFRDPAPDDRAAVGLGPDGDDPRRGVPPPQPFVFVRGARGRVWKCCPRFTHCCTHSKRPESHTIGAALSIRALEIQKGIVD
jgi:hypothetical protein